MINIVDTRNKIRTILEIEDISKNDLIDLVIEDSIDFFFIYTNVGELYMNKYEPLIRKLAIIRYNKLNSEGISSESYNGASMSYIDGLPKEILKELNSIRKLSF